MRGSKNICMLNTGIDPPPPPPHDENSKSCPISIQCWSPLPLNQQSGSAYAIFKHYSKWMLAFISLRVLQEGELLRNVPLYAGA